jgi:hypothetical protein
MSQLQDLINIDLNEDRTIILGVEILLGFSFSAVFSQGFNQLSLELRYMALAGTGFLIITTAFLIAPSTFQQMTPQTWSPVEFNTFVNNTMRWGLWFFAASLGTGFCLAASVIAGLPAGYFIGGAVFILALMLWYGYELYTRWKNRSRIKRETRDVMDRKPNDQNGVSLVEQVRVLFIESRVVLPGIQAVLGFQFASILTAGFQNMSQSLKLIHFFSMIMVLFSVILLIAPVAYHHITLEGVDTKRLVHFGGRMIIFSIVLLGLGLATDFYVVVDKITGSSELAIVGFGLTIALLFSVWFGYSIYLNVRFKKKSSNSRTG